MSFASSQDSIALQNHSLVVAVVQLRVGLVILILIRYFAIVEVFRGLAVLAWPEYFQIYVVERRFYGDQEVGHYIARESVCGCQLNSSRNQPHSAG